ncbi:MAG: serine protease [Bacteroidetes bacterium]|nr:serine protease [Bacteroidota bacterium]
MALNIETYNLIDRYLLGEMSAGEREVFEKQMQVDDELAKEVELQRELLTVMEEYERSTALRDKLDGFHEKLDMNEVRRQVNPPAVRRRKDVLRLSVTLAAAASVALAVTLGTLWKSGWFEFNRSENLYMELRNDLEDISSETKSLKKIIDSKKEVPAQKVRYNGTGFVLSSNGYLVTSYHVVSDVDSIFISHKLDTVIRYKVSMVYGDQSKDIAVLLITDSTFTSFGQVPYTFATDESELSEYVYTLGYSKEDVVFGEGTVSSLTGFLCDSTAFQISVPANPGISGAPVLDKNGNILGVIGGRHSKKEGATFALHSYFLKEIADSVKCDSLMQPPGLPSKNTISWRKRTDQVKRLLPFVFKVEVYKEE